MSTNSNMPQVISLSANAKDNNAPIEMGILMKIRLVEGRKQNQDFNLKRLKKILNTVSNQRLKNTVKFLSEYKTVLTSRAFT